MKRRLMLARALVHSPKVLILDEPTAGLDIELRRSLWDYLVKRNAEGMTIILTSHYLEEAEALCKRVAIIDGGQILRDTSTRDLLAELRNQTFILELSSEGQMPSEWPAGVQALVRDPLTWEVIVDHGVSMNQVFEVLNRAGIEVGSLRPRSNRLEELFVSLVGKKGKGLSA